MSTGFVAVPVVPTFKGMSKEFADRLITPAKKAGDQAGKAISGGLEGAVRSLESQVQASTRKLKDLDRAYENSRSKQKQRQQELTAATLKLKGAEEAYQKAVSSGKSGTAELAKIAAAKSKVEAATNNLKNAEIDLRVAEKKHEDQLKDLNATMEKHKKAQDDMAASAVKSKGVFSGLSDKFSEMMGSASEMGGPLGNAADLLSSFKLGPAAGVAAVAGALGTAAGAATKFNEDLAKSSVEMQNKLGLSATAARDMQRDVADALGSGMGDYQTTAESVMAIQQSLADNSAHMAGQSASALSDNFMAFAQTFQVGMSEAVSTVDIMLNTGLVKSAEDGVDLLTASMQRVPQALQGEVLDATNEYSKFFSNLGIEGPQAMQMLVKASEQGQYAIDKTGDAIKEFSLKAVDPTVVKTLGEMGVEVEDLAGRVARGGSEAGSAMSEMADAILGIEDDGKRAEAAVAAFGTPLEDLAIEQVPAFLETLSSGGDVMEDFAGASQRMADNTTQTLSGMFSSLKGKVHGWAIDVALDVDEVTGAAVEKIGGIVSGGWDSAMNSELVSNAKAAVSEIVAAFQGGDDGFAGLKGIFGEDTARYLVDFAAAAGEKLTELKDKATELWTTIEPYISQFLDYIGGSFLEIWDSLSKALGDVFQAVWELNTSIGGALWDVLQTVWDFISPVLIPVLKLAAGIIGGTLVIAIATLTEALKLGANIIEVFAEVLNWLVDNAIAPVIRWIGDFIVAVQDNFVPAMIAAADWVGEKWQEWSTILGAVWDWVKAYVLDKATEAIAAFAAWWDEKLGQISAAWNWMKDAVHAGWTWIDQNVFGPMRAGLDTLKGWFQSAVDGITSIWNGLKEAAARPIRFVVNTVWNEGLLKAISAVTKFIPGLDAPDPISLGFATGGVLPGYTPGRDIYEFVEPSTGMRVGLSGGEAILRPEATVALGKDWVDNVNAAARRGGAAAVRERLSHSHFANGGILNLGNFNRGGFMNLAGTLSAIQESHAKFVSKFFPGMFALTSASRSEPGSMHDFSRGAATDWQAQDGQYASQMPTPASKALARAIATNFPNTTQLIHWPLDGWVNILNGGPFDYGAATNSQHGNHVHWGTNSPLQFDGDDIKLTDIPGGGGAWFDPASLVKTAWDKVVGSITKFNEDGSWFSKIPGEFFSTASSKLWEFISSKANALLSAVTGGGPGGSGPDSVQKWSGAASEALRRAGYDDSYLGIMLEQIAIESGGDPNAVNDWDINAQNGVPSGGLLQVIEPTYRGVRAANPEAFEGLPDNRFDPVTNLTAGLLWTKQAYGGPGNVWPTRAGYADGGIIDVLKLAGAKLFDVGGRMPHGTLAYNASGEDEFVLKNSGMKSLGGILRILGDLVPAIKQQTNVWAAQVDTMQEFMVQASRYDSEAGITARQIVRGLLDLGLDLPGADVVSAVVDGEAAIWDARERAENHLATLAEKEQALTDARKALADLEADDSGMSKDDADKISEAEEKLAEARAEAEKADSEEKRAAATDKVADAESNLKKTREEVEANAKESAKQRADDIVKANESVAQAENDLAEARKAQVKDLDHVSLISADSIKALIPAAQGMAGKLMAMGVPAAAVTSGLSSVTSALSGAAAAVGPAGFTLGMAIDTAKVVIDIGKKIYQFVKDIIDKVRQARVEARKAYADAWAAAAEYASLTAEVQANVVSLQQALVRGLIEQRTAMFNLEVATQDRYVREVEGQLAVAEARLALDEEITNGALAAQIRLQSLHEDWDSYRTFEAEKAQGVLDAWSESAISALFVYEAARAEALKGDLEARVEQIRAEAALAEATRANLRNQQDLLTAQERLIRMSADVAGVDLVEATATEQVAKLMAELAEVQAGIDGSTLGRWGYSLGANGSYANEYRGQLAEREALRVALEAVMAETGVAVSDAELDRTLKLMARASRRDGDPLAVLRANMPELVAAETALKINESLQPIYDVQDSQLELNREVENFQSEIDLYTAVTPLEETIKGLEYTIQSLDQAASAWAEGNEELRGDYLRASAVNSDAAAALGVNWKLDDQYATDGVRQQIRKEVTVHMDGAEMYTADQVDELLREMTSGTGVSVTVHKSASLVASARRKERI